MGDATVLTSSVMLIEYSSHSDSEVNLDGNWPAWTLSDGSTA